MTRGETRIPTADLAESLDLVERFSPHGKDVLEVNFAWELDTHCPLPGSYALDAIATVKARGRADRQCSMFRFRRYAPDKLADCLRSLGWEEIGVWPYGGTEQPSSLRLFRKGPEPREEPARGTSADG